MRPRILVAVATLSIATLLAPALPAVAAPGIAPAAMAPAGASAVAPAKQVATAKLAIKKIGGQAVEKGKKVTVRPQYSTSVKVKVVSAKLTVKRGSKTLAKNTTKVSLAAGKYTVTQVVSYRLAAGNGWGKQRNAKLTQKLTVRTLAQGEVWAMAYNDQLFDLINSDRKARGLRVLDTSKTFSARLSTEFNRSNWAWLYAQPAGHDHGTSVKAGSKANARAAAKSAAKLMKREGEYKPFLSSKLARMSIATYVWWDSKGRPTAFESWIVAQ